MLARGTCQMFLLKGTCRYPSSLSIVKMKFCHRMLNNVPQESRRCANTIMECYRRKGLPSLYLNQSTNNENVCLEEGKVKDDLYRVILTARPDEFEKLPPKCSACGAIFQTKQEKQVGYINEVKFLDALKNDMLNRIICFNCYRLRHHNTPVISGIDSSDAMDQLRHLRQRTALILYVVDLFDMEGTMLRNILQLVGKRKRMIIVGNKIDRLPQDDKKPTAQLETMKDVLKDTAFHNGLENCNFRDICLVSARTGFGLKTLVEKINKHREDYMDVYLVGCANTGKSTLYNLIVNMLNVHKSNDLPVQAIEHHIPGTTSSLVREGISKYQATKLVKRLNKGPWDVEEVFDFDKELLAELGFKEDDERYKAMGMAAKYKKNDGMHKLLEERKDSLQVSPLEIVDKDFMKKGEKKAFLYDTPGILNPSQIIQYLTPSEINYLSPTQWVVPRTFVLKPGNCLFVGGLARLDYLSIKRFLEDKENNSEVEKYVSPEEMCAAAQSIYVTAMVSPNVPIHVTITETADEKFKKLFSDNVLELPNGSPERFNIFPKLEKCEYTIIGKSRNVNSCDLSLHGIGWLSIAAVRESRVGLALHTPNGEGQGLRLNPLLPYTVQRKAGRGLPYRGRINRYMYGHTRKRSPQFIRIFQQQNDPVYSWKVKVKQKMKQERFQKKENERLLRIEQGIVLGKRKAIKEKEEKLRLLEESNYARLLEEGK